MAHVMYDVYESLLQNHQLQQAAVRATKCPRGIEEPANNVSHVCKYSTNVLS